MNKTQKKETALSFIIPFFQAKTKLEALEILSQLEAVILIGTYPKESMELCVDAVNFFKVPVGNYLKIYEADFEHERRPLQFEAYKALRGMIDIVDLIEE